jgi:hypothetical protein
MEDQTLTAFVTTSVVYLGQVKDLGSVSRMSNKTC